MAAAHRAFRVTMSSGAKIQSANRARGASRLGNTAWGTSSRSPTPWARVARPTCSRSFTARVGRIDCVRRTAAAWKPTKLAVHGY